jgi:pimeloyl-ACP methyl ester carboxylesterase
MSPSSAAFNGTEVAIRSGAVMLRGIREVPAGAEGLVLFAHGSGSGRRSVRNRQVAAALRRCGLGTLLFDLLTEEEERLDARAGHLRFDIPFLAARLGLATAWARADPEIGQLPLGYFGASTGAAAALLAAAKEGTEIRAVVSRGGRPDLAGHALGLVRAPTLLIVGGDDADVLALNEAAFARLAAVKRLEVVAGAGHLFEEPGALETVAIWLAGGSRNIWSTGVGHDGPGPLP